MADDLRKLLLTIIRSRLVPQESREIQMEAPATKDVSAEITAQVKEQQEQAEKLAPYFSQGLRLAAGGPLTVDDTDPTGNMIADAFARYMLTTNLATSQSVELPGGGYSYTFEIDWPAVRAIAQSAGIDLDSALRSA